jgi:hypothetical protein
MAQYLEEYYNMNNLDVFLLYGSQNLDFMKEIKKEYEDSVGQLVLGQVDINPTTQSNNQVLKEEELRDKLQELFFKRIKEDDLVRIMEEHQRLSHGLGILVGIAGRG